MLCNFRPPGEERGKRRTENEQAKYDLLRTVAEALRNLGHCRRGPRLDIIFIFLHFIQVFGVTRAQC